MLVTLYIKGARELSLYPICYKNFMIIISIMEASTSENIPKLPSYPFTHFIHSAKGEELFHMSLNGTDISKNCSLYRMYI